MLPGSMATGARGEPVPAQPGTHREGSEDSSDSHAVSVDAAAMEALASARDITHPARASRTHAPSIPKRSNRFTGIARFACVRKAYTSVNDIRASGASQCQTHPTRSWRWEDAGATGGLGKPAPSQH